MVARVCLCVPSQLLTETLDFSTYTPQYKRMFFVKLKWFQVQATASSTGLSRLIGMRKDPLGPVNTPPIEMSSCDSTLTTPNA